jgi:hypothetical protein
MASWWNSASRRAVLHIDVHKGLFPLRQGADALETVVGGDAGQRAVMPTSAKDHTTDRPRRAGKPDVI